MPKVPEHGLRPQQPCYVCQASTRKVCDRCNRPICIEHSVSHVQMHWETWFAGGSRGGASWTRYLPNGALLRICPACEATLNARDAAALAHDHTMVRFQVIGSLVLLLGGLFAIYGLPFLLSHFVWR